MERRGRLVAAPDKLRGTARATDVAAAVGRAARAAGWACDEAPVADGGEGTLEVLAAAMAAGDDSAWRRRRVRGPLGETLEASWVLAGDTAVVEMSLASGLAVVGGPEANDPVRASTYGTGELICAAVEAGARRVIVAVGGSATTDGGLGAVSALQGCGGLPPGVELVVACDVTATFVEAAELFAPQKGATPAQVALLRRRLERLAAVYRRDYGVDVREVQGSGAAGGLAGGLAALGASLVPGFDVVADAISLADRVAAADLVVTGEGLLDAASFRGKAVGGVVRVATDAGVPVLVVAGDVEDPAPASVGGAEPAAEGTASAVTSLVARFGRDRAVDDTLACIETAVSEHLAGGSRR